MVGMHRRISGLNLLNKNWVILFPVAYFAGVPGWFKMKLFISCAARDDTQSVARIFHCSAVHCIVYVTRPTMLFAVPSNLEGLTTDNKGLFGRDGHITTISTYQVLLNDDANNLNRTTHFSRSHIIWKQL